MSANTGISVKFWGVRGSVPAPLTPTQVENKIVRGILAALNDGLGSGATIDQVTAWTKVHLPFAERSTFGGNTTCLEVRCDDTLIVLDMGTGLRELGLSLIGETVKNKGLKGTILQSHVHWDHIQGYPFWAQLYMPRRIFDNEFSFYGGKQWDKSLEEVLRLQMDEPVFPVEHGEIEMTALKMHFDTVYDNRVIVLPGDRGDIKIVCRKLNHPQETYGYRIEYAGQTLTFCTDHEPFGSGLPRPLIELAKGADIFITDCQYSLHEYVGEGGKVQKLGWGHSYPEYIGAVAAEAKPRLVVTTHHDPQSDDRRVVELARDVERIGGISTVPAYEGLLLRCR